MQTGRPVGGCGSQTGNGIPAFSEIAAFLDRLLLAERFDDDPTGVYRDTARSVAAIGLALDPWPGLTEWVAREGLDALFVHRPWTLPLDRLGDVGVLAYHLAFDERLTVGFNPRLAEALGMTDLEVLGRKAGRPIGMLGTVAEQGIDNFRQALASEFGGLEGNIDGDGRVVTRVAVVGAMTAPLVEGAAARGAEVSVTGQLRAPARAAIEAIGLAVIAVGHRRAELWGLRVLAREL